MSVRNVLVDAAGPLVSDVMLSAPNTVSADVTLNQARQLLSSPRQRTVLVADAGGFVGTVPIERLAQNLDGETTLGELADRDFVSVRPDEPTSRALEVLYAEGGDRLPVLDARGRLVGLICLNRRRGHFCVD
jgi:CBS domain-containing protein